MSRETVKERDNRAVTPWFRVCGGRLKEPAGDAVRVAEVAALHRVEWVVLAILVPAVLAAMLFDGLWRIGGPWLAGLGLLPALFVGLQVLSFGFGRRSPRGAFWCWALVLGVWSAWAIDSDGWLTRSAGWVWLGFLGLQVVGLLGWAWKSAMAVAGTAGLVLRTALAVGVHLVMAWIWWRHGWYWGLLYGAGVAGLWASGTFRPESRLFGPMATRVRGRGVLLTIDDGPDAEDTREFLEQLDRFGAKAVFFVIGEKVREFPELAREIVARGHELGNHTMTHPQASMWCAGPMRTRREISDCQRAIEEVAGSAPRWFRAPVGHRNFFTHPVTSELGLEVVAWTRRAFDTVETDVEKMTSRLTDDLEDGDVLLMHQGTPVSVELLAKVLERLKASGLLEDDQVVVEGSAAPQG
ncbi:polysaccharide deacetylase family protein [Haloferula sp. A504]|uniref:polysaccharide deacetylase family protein n=1 Tax=Haloferula sp. A504 TaxID=3373601 RepID=UPI0031C02EF4|nr:polysaccharide deacetylase family protein [Verrucomicrobiaceae bacterium E54]